MRSSDSSGKRAGTVEAYRLEIVADSGAYASMGAMLPFLTRILGPAEFGRLDVLNALVSAAVLTLLLGLDVAATRLAFDIDATARGRLFSTWYLINAITVSQTR